MKPCAVFVSLLACALSLSAETIRIVQTNSGSDEQHVIDPATNEIVKRIPGLPRAHGVAFSPDGHTAYFTVEGNNTVAKVDLDSGEILASVDLSGHPNNISASKDGKYVFAAIFAVPGAVDVIDTESMTLAKTIPVEGAVHNTYTTPDGKYAIAGSVASKMLTVIDTETLEVAWAKQLSEGPRPIAFKTAPDGSTDLLYIQLSQLHGFIVFDFNKQEEVARIILPDEPAPGGFKAGAPAHGIALTPDQQTLLVDSSVAEGVFFYSVPDHEYLGYLATGVYPDWITITPDGKTAYVANSGSNTISVIDIATRTETAKIEAGDDPKRNATVVME